VSSDRPPPRIPEGWAVVGLAGIASLTAFLCYFRQDALLLYGDAVAHLHIARRVVDGRYPGPLQLGTVWLPLPHVLMLPLVAVDWMWRTGVAGAVVSMASYVAGTAGVFRLVRGAVEAESAHSRVAPWLAAAVFALNPNLLYLQTTAMTEPPYLALFVWTVVFLSEFARQARGSDARAGGSLERAAIALSAAMLTRYDGWFLAAACGPIVLWVMWKLRGSACPALKRSLRNSLLLTALTPALWLAYNFGQYGNPLEFLTGPYSTRAIEQRSGGGHPVHPGEGSLPVAALYFSKAAQLNLGPGRAAQGLMLAAAMGALLCWWRKRGALSVLLWLPLAFYTLSVAYGGVQIFVPVWWPFSYNNPRYGIELLPAVAVGAGLLAANFRGRLAQVVAAGVALLAAVSYGGNWRAVPVSLREAQVNAATRVAFETKLATELKKLPPGSTLLMYCGDHPGALMQAGIPLRRVIHEGNRAIAEGEYSEWEQALETPGTYADYVVAIAGDPVGMSAARNQPRLQEIAAVEGPGRPRAVIYQTQGPTPP
jgi:hypothetical protein